MERILFVVKAREFGGLEIVLLDWLSQVDYSQVSIAICSHGTDTLRQKLSSLAPQVESIPLNISDDAPVWDALPAWRRLLSSTRSDKIIFLEGGFGDLGLTPVLAARLSPGGSVFLFAGGGGTARSAGVATTQRKLHFGFLPGLGLHRYKQILRQRLRSSLLQRSFVSSQELKDNITADFRLPDKGIAVLYHGVDTARFQPSSSERVAFRRASGIPDDAIVIVSHGRLAPVKRVDRILKAFALLSSEHPNLWLLLTCYGPLREEVERTVESNVAYRRVKLVAFQNDATSLLKAADIYVLASDREGFGIALVEAMSTGLVCVATNCHGPAGILANGENGILVETTDQDVLAGLRRAILLGPDERGRLVAQARKTVQERFEISAAVRRALDSMKIPRH